jgi:hypothetical protein
VRLTAAECASETVIAAVLLLLRLSGLKNEYSHFPLLMDPKKGYQNGFQVGAVVYLR